MTDTPRRAPIGLTIAVLISLAILIALGAWQLQRLQWKQQLIAQVAALQAAPAAPIGPVMARVAQGADVGFTRVSVVCPGLAAAPFLQLFGLRDGQPGVRLISACPLSDGPYGTILVDRGFVPDAVAERPAVDPAGIEPVAMTGVLRAPDKPTFVTPPNEPDANRWYARDIAAMARRLSATRPAPVFLMAETSSNPDWAELDPVALPTDIPNRHLEYALTWFGLAAALIGVYAAVLWKRRKA